MWRRVVFFRWLKLTSVRIPPGITLGIFNESVYLLKWNCSAKSVRSKSTPGHIAGNWLARLGNAVARRSHIEVISAKFPSPFKQIVDVISSFTLRINIGVGSALAQSPDECLHHTHFCHGCLLWKCSPLRIVGLAAQAPRGFYGGATVSWRDNSAYMSPNESTTWTYVICNISKQNEEK